MKNLKNIFITLIIFISAPLAGAQRPPQPPQHYGPSLAGLPLELKQQISQINTESGPILNIPARARRILRLAATDNSFRTAINQPKNMLAILQALPTKAAAVYLAEKLEKMPGIQSKEVQDWLNGIQLEKGQELFEAVNAESPDPTIVAGMLRNPNIDLNWKDKDNDSAIALVKAIAKGHREIVKRLLDAGAKINQQFGMLGSLPISLASGRGDAEIVGYLIAAGANVNTPDLNGRTALMSASQRGNTEIVDLLLKAGADPELKDTRKQSAKDLALKNNHIKVVKILDDAIAARKAKMEKK